MSKIEKTLTRQRQRIAEGQYYEAHQQLRVITSRYLKASPPNYNAAFDLLASGAQALFEAGQGGSGGDLCLYLVDTYGKAELRPDAASKGRVLSLLRAFPEGEPTKKRFVNEMVGWSAKYGEYPAGDPELHHVAGQIFAEGTPTQAQPNQTAQLTPQIKQTEGDPYEAERHLTLGTRDSPPTLAALEYTWYASDADPSTAPHYLARAVLPLLLAGNLRGANQALLLFTSRLAAAHPGLGVQDVGARSADCRVYPSLPLLNFLSLLLLACGRGGGDLFRSLRERYKGYLGELGGGWDEALEGVGQTYFGVRAPRQGNLMMDMMSSMFMGGGGAGKAKGGAQKVEVPVPAPAVD